MILLLMDVKVTVINKLLKRVMITGDNKLIPLHLNITNVYKITSLINKYNIFLCHELELKITTTRNCSCQTDQVIIPYMAT